MSLTNYQKHTGQRYFNLEALFQAVIYVCKGTLLIDFSRRVGFSVFQVSLLSTVYTVGGLASVAAAYFYERSRSNRRFMLVSYALYIVLFFSAVGIGLVSHDGGRSTWFMLGLILASMLAYQFYQIPFMPWHQDLVATRVWGSYMGRRLRLWNVVEIIAYLGFSRVIDMLGEPLALPGYAGIYALALLCGMGVLWSVSRVPEEPRPPAAATRFPEDILWQPLRSGNFRIFCLTSFLFFAGLAFYIPFVNLLLLEDLGVSLFAISIYSAISAVVGIGFYRVWGIVSDRMGNRVVLRAAFLSIALLPFFWVAVYAGGRTLLFVPFLFCNAYGALGIWGSGFLTAYRGLEMTLTPRQNKSSYLAVLSLHAAFGTFCGALLAGSMVRRLPSSYDIPFLGIGAVPGNLLILPAVSFFMLACFFLSRFVREKPTPLGSVFRELLNVKFPVVMRSISVLDNTTSAEAQKLVSLQSLMTSTHSGLPRDTLLGFIHDPNPDIRLKAIECLGAMGGPEEGKALVDVLPQRQPAEQARIIESLGTMGYANAADTIAAFLGADRPVLCSAAILALGKLKIETYAPRLVDVLHSDNVLLAADACQALASMGNTGHLNRMRELLYLSYPYYLVPRQIALALGQLLGIRGDVYVLVSAENRLIGVEVVRYVKRMRRHVRETCLPEPAASSVENLLGSIAEAYGRVEKPNEFIDVDFRRRLAQCFALLKPAVRTKHGPRANATSVTACFSFLESAVSDERNDYLWEEFIVGLCCVTELLRSLRVR